MDIETTKTCRKCKTEKTLDLFYSSNQCYECRAKWEREYRARNKDKSSAKGAKWYANNKASAKRRAIRNYYPRAYGMSAEKYNDMFIEQGGCCAICGVHQSDVKKKLCVDHCHETGVIRGLLCHNCNIAIGMANDSKEILENCIKYLER